MSILELILDDDTIASIVLIGVVAYAVAAYFGYMPSPTLPHLL